MHDKEVCRHRNQRAGYDAEELRYRLLAWVATEEIAALEIGQQVGGVGSRPRCDGCGHQVGRDVGWRENSIDELRNLSHGADGSDVGFTCRARRHN